MIAAFEGNLERLVSSNRALVVFISLAMLSHFSAVADEEWSQSVKRTHNVSSVLFAWIGNFDPELGFGDQSRYSCLMLNGLVGAK